MVNKGPRKEKKASRRTSAADFPALRQFLRGYFHQDLAEEYGSPEAAARQFCQDADTIQRRKVSYEWTSFLGQMQGKPLESVARFLSDSLGSAWAPASVADLDSITRVLQRADFEVLIPSPPPARRRHD
jgi:hypothetical protein